MVIIALGVAGLIGLIIYSFYISDRNYYTRNGLPIDTVLGDSHPEWGERY